MHARTQTHANRHTNDLYARGQEHEKDAADDVEARRHLDELQRRSHRGRSRMACAAHHAIRGIQIHHCGPKPVFVALEQLSRLFPGHALLLPRLIHCRHHFLCGLHVWVEHGRPFKRHAKLHCESLDLRWVAEQSDAAEAPHEELRRRGHDTRVVAFREHDVLRRFTRARHQRMLE